ncbi:hypothetical protein Tco_0141194, partial [Tanacetum coccineum]
IVLLVAPTTLSFQKVPIDKAPELRVQRQTCPPLSWRISTPKRPGFLLPCTLAIASKMPYFVALVAFLGARTIVVKMALGALGQRSLIRLPFTCPYIVDLGNILPIEGLLLVAMVFSG